MADIMTPEEFEEYMNNIPWKDAEREHIEADKVVVELLKQLGYERGAEIYQEICDDWFYYS